VIDLLGITIHEPDVVFTDLALALLGAYFWRRLWTMRQESLSKAGSILMAGLASAAFWGAIFHAFFPGDTATSPGFVAWLPVALSICVAAAAMLELALRIVVPRLSLGGRRAILAAYAAGFGGVVLLVDESFTSIVRFYVPALVLFLIGSGWQAISGRGGGWSSIAAGLLISAGAALLQQAEVAIHPDYFDHNAVYHVLQSIALVFLYLGFRRIPEPAGRVYAAGANPASRPG
jgi:uncharacterized protein DUF6962